MKQLIHARLVLPDRIIEDGSITFSNVIEKISEDNEKVKGATVINVDGATVIPGLIDLHIHGYLGEDASDGDAKGVEKMAEGIAKNGVTAFLPTTMTLPYGDLEGAFNAIRKAMSGKTPNGAEILGVHAEGPFINPKKCGAQPKEYAVNPDADFVIRHKDIIRILTMAPETDADFAAIRKIKEETDVVISIGHTDADYDLAKASFDAGITHVTHLFNAMTPMNHRAPGVVGAALTCPCVSCELICDTFHINPALFRMVHKLKGNRFNLITDCMRAGGLPDGVYELGGQTVYVNGIRCLLSDGVIAGSVLKLNQAVKNCVDAGLSVCEAVNSASLYPAMAINVQNERGSLEIGKRADIVICDQDFNVKNVFREGKQIVS
ncbi:MAG: N-acetylglucosamine-6-phosphate deacetylase [Clostridia bacterium]|nr:N-acetylglucosamine-6-phosphate deacetylase [Clostridia bacterium]